MEYTAFRNVAERLMEEARASMQADGRHQSVVFVLSPEDRWEVVCLYGDQPVPKMAKTVVQRRRAQAAVVVNEVTFHESVDGVILPEYHFDALAVVCVHPGGHVVWVTPFAKEHGITIGKTKVMEGEEFRGDITDILK